MTMIPMPLDTTGVWQGLSQRRPATGLRQALSAITAPLLARAPAVARQPGAAVTDAGSNEAWHFICDLYPAINHEFAECGRYGEALAAEFRARVLRDNAYDTPARIAEALKYEWLTEFIGGHALLRVVVRLCMDSGLTEAAEAVRHAAILLGEDRAAHVVVPVLGKALGRRDAAELPTPRSALPSIPNARCRRGYEGFMITMLDGGLVHVTSRPDARDRPDTNLVFVTLAHALQWLLHPRTHPHLRGGRVRPRG